MSLLGRKGFLFNLTGRARAGIKIGAIYRAAIQVREEVKPSCQQMR